MRPSLKDFCLEVPRAAKELYNFLEIRNEQSNVGEDHPVIVYPGFLTGDWSTSPLRTYLNNNGFVAYGWQQGTNVGFSPQRLKNLYTHIEHVHKRHEKPVALIGWSLGGIYARELARYSPRVDKVVTLSSPFANIFANNITAIYQIVSDQHTKHLKQLSDITRQPLSKPSLNVYTKRDGVVHWTSCHLQSDLNAVAKEVESCHTGIGWNQEALDHIVDFCRPG